MTLDSPAAVVARLLSCFKSEQLDFDWAWREIEWRMKMETQPLVWQHLIGSYRGAFEHAYADRDFNALSAVLVATIERLARDLVSVAAQPRG